MQQQQQQNNNNNKNFAICFFLGVFFIFYWCNNSNDNFYNRLHIVYSIAISYYLVIFTLILKICIMQIIAKVPSTYNYDNTEIQIQDCVH